MSRINTATSVTSMQNREAVWDFGNKALISHAIGATTGVTAISAMSDCLAPYPATGIGFWNIFIIEWNPHQEVVPPFCEKIQYCLRDMICRYWNGSHLALEGACREVGSERRR